MSRRPAYDEVASVVVLDHPGGNGGGNPQQHQQNSQNVSQPYKSNLLSNENVIAFASGVVIDDGSATAAAAAASQQIPVQKCMNTAGVGNKFNNVSRR